MRMILRQVLSFLLLTSTLAWGDVLQCVNSRKGDQVLYWSQVGPPGTPVVDFSTLVTSGASPVSVLYELDDGSGAIGQEGTNFVGDFRIGDYLLFVDHPRTLGLALGFMNSSGLPTGVSQAGAQFTSAFIPRQLEIVAYDKNVQALGVCDTSLQNHGKEDNSAPYFGIEDLTAPNIAFVSFFAQDGFVMNTVSITTPGCYVPPNNGGASFYFSEVFASVGTDISFNHGVVEGFPLTGSPLQTFLDGTNAGDTAGTAFDAAGNLYVTNFDIGTVSKIDKTGVATPLFANTQQDGQKEPESIRAVGIFSNLSDLKLYVGGPTQCPSGPCILQYDAAGTLQKTILVGAAGLTGGTDWIDFLTPDIVVYSGEGPEIRAFNITTNTQLPDLISAGGGYQFRVARAASPGYCGVPTCTLPDPYILVGHPNFPGAPNGALIDPTPWLNAKPLGSTQAVIIKDYALPPGFPHFALAADPDRQHFWTGTLGFFGSTNGTVMQVDSCTAQIGHIWNAKGQAGVGGLTVWGGLGSVW